MELRRSLKVLAIGNSFSVDSMQWIYPIAKDCGVEEIVLGNLYIGGCSLSMHWDNAVHDCAAYIYYKNTDGSWTEESDRTIQYGIKDEKWDIITLQQVSGLSGIESTYNSDLDHLIEYVHANKTNAEVKLAWHMTWAYQSDSDHPNFSNYNNNQSIMYHSICRAVQNKIVPNNEFFMVIPVGTAIQNVRTSIIGDTLTRDGFHLSVNLGRYIAGMTWVCSLTGLSIDNVTYVPSTEDIPEEYLPIIKNAVKAAVKKPFEVTVIG